MKKIRYISIILLVALIFQNCIIININAETQPTIDDLALQTVNEANNFFKKNLGIDNFYDTKYDSNQPLQKELAAKGNPTFDNRPVLVYGNKRL